MNTREFLPGHSVRCTTFLALVLAASAGVQAIAAEGNGTYYRLDTGGASHRGNTINVRESDSINTTGGVAGTTVNVSGNTAMNGTEWSSTYMNFGVGYRLSRIFRADVTLTSLPRTISASSGEETVSGSTFIPGVGTAAASVNVPASRNNLSPTSVDSSAVMINGYLDLAGFWPQRMQYVQPYLSMGIGLSRNSMDSTVANITSWNTGQTATVGLPSHTQTGRTWSIGVGAAVPLNEGVTLDLGYKYLDLGDAKSGTGTFASPYTGGSTLFQNFDAKAKLVSRVASLGIRFGF